MSIKVHFPRVNRVQSFEEEYATPFLLALAAVKTIQDLEVAAGCEVIKDLMEETYKVTRTPNVVLGISASSVREYVDMNPRLLIYHGNLRFSAYRQMRKLSKRDRNSLTDVERELILADEGSVSEKENFLGTYSPIENSFEVIGKPWFLKSDLLTKEERNIINDYDKGKRRFAFREGSYRWEIL